MAVNQSLTLSQVSQDPVENTSRVRLLWLSTQTGASYNGYENTAKYWVRVNGGDWEEFAVRYTLPQNQTVTVADVTLTVQHDAQGACLVEAATQMDTGISAGRIELSRSFSPDTIARYSLVSATDALIGGISTVRIEKCSSAYKHCLRYSLTGGAPWTYLDESGRESQQEVIFSRDTVSFRIPESFYHKIPAAKSGICTLECWTYVTDTRYLPLGKRTTFTYTADPGKCGPSVDCTLKDTNAKTLAVTGSASTLVRYMSDVQVDIRAQANCGAAIADPTGDISLWYNGDWHYGQSLQFSGAETDFFKLWARDSRGYEVYKNYHAPEFIQYVRLTNQTMPRRLTPTGSEVQLHIGGSCFAGHFGGTKQLANTVRVWYRQASTREGLGTATWREVVCTQTGNSYAAAVQLEVSYDAVSWVETWVEDKLTYVTQVVKIGRGEPVFDWGEEDFCFHVPVAVPALTVGGMALDVYIKNVIQGGSQ